MRRFTFGSGADRSVVVIELIGTRMSIVRTMPDNSTKRSNRDFGSDAQARSASEQMAQELISRGYAERAARDPNSSDPAVAASKPSASLREYRAAAPNSESDDVYTPAPASAPSLPRAAAPSGKSLAENAPEKKKKTGGKKKKKKQNDDALDKRVLAGIAAFVLALIGVIGYVVYDAFIKPPTIVGVWRGGMVEHEISRSLTLTQYDLVLDDKGRAALTVNGPLEEPTPLVGTYAVKGNRLKLTVKDEDGDSSDREYKISLGRVTLELFDLESGKLLVQLLRFREAPVVRPLSPRRPKRPVPPPAGDADTVDDSDE